MSLLEDMFAHPRGLPGRLGGLIMARLSGSRNAWILSQLAIQPGERILEVGFGPGAAISALANMLQDGSIVGVDNSSLMLCTAAKRNARAIRAGRVQLYNGSALALPCEDASFDRAFSINSVQIWPDSLAGIKEMQRILKPGGLLNIALQPVWVKTDAEVRKVGEDLVELLKRAGFQQTRLEFKSMKPMACVCALGIK